MLEGGPVEQYNSIDHFLLITIIRKVLVCTLSKIKVSSHWLPFVKQEFLASPERHPLAAL